MIDDPLLTGLIRKATTDNLSVREALSRVREARARRNIGRADFYPAVDDTYSQSTSRSRGETGDSGKRKLYSTGLDAGWEIDIFGTTRSAVAQLTANLEAYQAGLDDIRISMAAETALNYIDVRIYQAKLKVAQDNLRIQEETYQLNHARFQAGLADELAMHQAAYNLESTRARVPVIEAALGNAMNRLAVLVGTNPGTLHRDLMAESPIPDLPPIPNITIPADTLRKRPDIRQAERNLAAAHASVAEAQGDRYPKLSLNGSIGISALHFDSLFDTGNRSYSYGPRITLPIFNRGAIKNNITVQTEREHQALLQYEATVLNALEEVENSIENYTTERKRINALKAAATAASQAVNLSQAKYQTGLIDFSVVLDAQRALLTYQDQVVESRGNIAADLVRLYKAMGGGFVSGKATGNVNEHEGIMNDQK